MENVHLQAGPFYSAISTEGLSMSPNGPAAPFSLSLGIRSCANVLQTVHRPHTEGHLLAISVVRVSEAEVNTSVQLCVRAEVWGHAGARATRSESDYVCKAENLPSYLAVAFGVPSSNEREFAPYRCQDGGIFRVLHYSPF